MYSFIFLILYRSKNRFLLQVMKTAFGFAALAACSLSIAVDYENETAWIVVSIILFGLFGFAVYPIGLEAGVEATYPVAEATSTGLIIMMGLVRVLSFCY